GDLTAAEEYLTAAIEAFREVGDEWSLAFALFNLATLARSNGHIADAARHLQERLRLQLKLGDEARTAETYIGLGITWLAASDLEAAEKAFARAREVVKRLNNVQDEVDALEGLAVVDRKSD